MTGSAARTTQHALDYLHQSKAYAAAHPACDALEAFRVVTKYVTAPCRAIGVAKTALKDATSALTAPSAGIDRAISLLEAEL